MTTKTTTTNAGLVALSIVLAAILFAPRLEAQLAERPGTSIDTSRGPRDLSGLSIKTPRIRAIHTKDTGLAGGSYWLQTMDPFLAWKWGKDFTQREFKRKDGVYAFGTLNDVAGFQGILTDRFSPAIVNNDQVSCGGCHNMPYRDAGAGTNFSKKSGLGRNATHFFGSGIQEMIAWQVRQKVMQQIDTNHDNWISFEEMNANPILVRPAPGAEPINYGVSGDPDGDGVPNLDLMFRIWYVDSNGRVLEDATGLKSPGVAGYNFMMEVFGWGEKIAKLQLVRGRSAQLNNTNRVFAWDPFETHGGLEAFDPTTDDDPDRDGFSQVSNAGFQQSWISHIPPDRGRKRNSVGLSIDDPDGDGYISEITEGDLDMAEWYMTNSPRPAVGKQSSQTRNGQNLFVQSGCAGCHVLDWKIEASDLNNPDVHKRYNGDLRFFDLDVNFNDKHERLEGKLVRLYDVDAKTGEFRRRRGSFDVKGIGTDFKHHEMGANFVDVQFDGGLVTNFRTAPLWGNGATGFPWGHDGKSMTLDAVIRRHGGEAATAKDAYAALGAEDREAVVAWIDSLTLYSTDQVPTDIDGDGRISEHFKVQGKDTGIERFNPEWLFRIPGKIEGTVRSAEGKSVSSDALVNIEDAYGLRLPGLLDSDHDGFADLQDLCPNVKGYKDGCR